MSQPLSGIYARLKLPFSCSNGVRNARRHFLPSLPRLLAGIDPSRISQPNQIWATAGGEKEKRERGGEIAWVGRANERTSKYGNLSMLM